MLPFTEDIGVFFATIYGGISIGILFDIYRACKSNFNVIKAFSILYDVVFWIIVTSLVFITINVVESFDLRYYHFIALFVGFIVYYKTVSIFVFNALNKFISLILRTIKKFAIYICKISVNLYYVIIYSIHFLFDTIFYIPNLIFNIFKFIKFKSRKFRLKKLKSRV
ncbi:MAG: spore cortex biosynthesis protein YabQ [Paraclostridium sp.]